MKSKVFLAGLVLLFAVLVVSASVAEDQFLFLDKIRPGMEGSGKTVVKGDKIREFQVTVIDVIDEPGELNDYILIRASGDAIKESGGISAGMSGSPVYIDGKLIGAISAAALFDVSENPVALVTPVGNMLKLIEPVKQKVKERQETEVKKSSQNEVEDLEKKTKKGKKALPTAEEPFPNTLFFKKLSTPVSVAGLNGRAFQYLKEGVAEQVLQNNISSLLKLNITDTDDFLQQLQLGMEERYDLTLYRSGLGSLQTPASKIDLEPGSPIGAQLVSGDVSFTAIGTLTYREGDILLAFGHPFLFSGDAEMFLTAAHILDTVESLLFPFKLGVPGKPAGAILEDRMQGIAGAIGIKPRSVQVAVKVKNLETKLERKFNIDIVDQPNLLASLLFSSVLQTIDESLNRIGKGTLSFSYEITGEKLPKKLVRKDIFSSESDIAITAPLQIAQIVHLLAQNEFVDPKLTKINIEINVGKEVKALRIKSLKIDKESYKPGELVNYTVILKPYRGDELTVSGVASIPEDTSSRRLILHVFGGPRPSGKRDREEPQEFESLEELIAAIEKINSNDKLTVEILGLQEMDEEDGKIINEQSLENWVVTGEKTVEIKIEAPKHKEEELEEEEYEEEEQK